MAAADLQQIAAAQPLQPQRRPLAGLAARQQQRRAAFCRKRRANRGCRPIRRGSTLPRSPASGRRTDPGSARPCRSGGSGCRRRGAALRLIAEPLPQPRLQRQPQRQVQPRPERAEQDHLPVAELIARRLDEQRASRSAGTGGDQLPRDVMAEIAGRGGVEEDIRAAASRAVRGVEAVRQLAEERADGQAEIVAASAAFAAPERRPSPALPRPARRSRDPPRCAPGARRWCRAGTCRRRGVRR